MSIGDRLREFGLKKYKTLKLFAEALEMPPSSLQLYLNGKREPGTPIFIRLYNLGCNIDWLISGVESNQCDNSVMISELSEEVLKLKTENDNLKIQVQTLKEVIIDLNISNTTKKREPFRKLEYSIPTTAKPQ